LSGAESWLTIGETSAVFVIDVSFWRTDTNLLGANMIARHSQARRAFS